MSGSLSSAPGTGEESTTDDPEALPGKGKAASCNQNYGKTTFLQSDGQYPPHKISATVTEEWSDPVPGHGGNRPPRHLFVSPYTSEEIASWNSFYEGLSAGIIIVDDQNGLMMQPMELDDGVAPQQMDDGGKRRLGSINGGTDSLGCRGFRLARNWWKTTVRHAVHIAYTRSAWACVISMIGGAVHRALHGVMASDYSIRFAAKLLEGDHRFRKELEVRPAE